jgi:Methyltransferase FkbM domain
MTLDEFLQNTLCNLFDYRENTKLFPPSEDFAFVDYCLTHFKRSRSQVFQDLFVLYHFREKPYGFFVEFGATNGVDLSNSYLLEKQFQWNGILAEPARCWREALKRNRGCIIDNRCVWEKSGEQLQFKEVAIPELSTIEVFTEKDRNAPLRADGELYPVTTVSLNDLLGEHKAPRIIDYMSVDTEGSELRILSAFDFDRYDVRAMSIEHNDTEDREKIYSLMVSRGYRRVFEKFSRWDDWYVRG